MTIYSWFDKDKTTSTSLNGIVENELLATKETTTYLENFTMWPTAKIKPNADVKPQNYNNINKKDAKKSRESLSSTPVLNNIVTK